MGKKNKDKKKVSGAVKTAAKTEKKMEAKRKKELADLGEEDIEAVVAQIEKEEAKRSAVVETNLKEPPTPRVNGTLTAHPTNVQELFLFGGEHHNGQETVMYNDLLVYNTAKNDWRLIKAPSAPPPRSAHQAIALAANKGELWIFGGEFTSPKETQFYHYRELWCFSIADRKWEKVQKPAGPSGRSGHRMVALGRKIAIFGGYSDSGRDCKYFDDLYIFCTEARSWSKIELSGGPSPRSACVLMPVGNDTILIYGGYSRNRIGKSEIGQTHSDMFKLSPAKSPDGSSTWKWTTVRNGGIGKPSTARSGVSVAVASQQQKAYVFGGVADTAETDEQLSGELSNELYKIDLENIRWHNVTLRNPKSQEAPCEKLEKVGLDHGADASTEQMDISEPVTIQTDEVFTMTLGGAPSVDPIDSMQQSVEVGNTIFGPSPRMNAMMTIQKSILYVYGGLLEKGDKQFTLSDMYGLDLHKLDEWKILIEQRDLPEWLGSDSESDDSDESGSDKETDSDTE